MSFIREYDNLPLPQNFASHDSDEFPIRRTGNDNVATALEGRQADVRRLGSKRAVSSSAGGLEEG